MSHLTKKDLARQIRPQQEVEVGLNRLKAKAWISRQIAEDIAKFLENGGEITTVSPDATADLAYYGKPKGIKKEGIFDDEIPTTNNMFQIADDED